MTTAPSSPPEAAIRLVAQAAERLRREVVLARFIGKFAVDRGLRELSDRVAAVTAPTASSAPTAAAAGGSLSERTATERTVPDAPELMADLEVPGPESAIGVHDLALVDYDHLSSAQIVAKLSDLDGTERDEIAVYERSHRRRRTILGKLEQLATT